MDVVALGELLIDFTPVSVDASAYPTLAAKLGGAPCNFLAALQVGGCSTALIAKVGADRLGNLLKNTAAMLGIETRSILSDPEVFTTLAFVSLDETGNRTFDFARKPGADICLREDEIDFSLIDEAKVFHFGSVSLTHEPSRSATQKAVSYAKNKACLISFDPNLRRDLWPNETLAKEQILWALTQADIVKISDEEIDFLFGCSPEDGAELLLRNYGVQLIYVTLGPKGCFFATKHAKGSVPCPSGIKVIDTTGAGDIFGGTAMAQLLKLGKDISDLTETDLQNITRYACCAASLSTQVYGGMGSIPQEEAVRAIL